MKTSTALTTILIISGVLGLAISAMAESPKSTDKAMEYRGDIIDGMCLGAHQDKEALKAFVPTHTKECVLKPGCRESGMNLYEADGTILKFDKTSDMKIVSFLEKKDSKLQVVITAKKNPDNSYSLISIKNQ